MTVLGDRRIGAAVVTLFSGAALAGAAALHVATSRAGTPLGAADAVFTSVSALTLTGLTVVDTDLLPRTAQAVLATLIAVGAVGVTTVVIGALRALGRVSWGATQALGVDLGTGRDQLGRLLGVVGAGTAAVVATCTVALRAGGLAWPDAAFYALSGFANAGFVTLPGSLTPLSPFAVGTVAVLVVVGGCGYVAWFEILDRLRGRTATLGMTARLVVVGTAVLLPAGTALLLVTEHATLGALPVGQRLGTAAVLSVMPRSAGFALADSAGLSDATKLVTTVLMYIGAGPASTGGGIKLTGAAVLSVAVWSAMRGHSQVGTRRWRLDQEVIMLATAVAVAVAATATVTAVVLAQGGASYGDAVFDAMSAATTTGLSTGVIAEAGPAGRWAAVAAMLIGRLGPMLVAVRLSRPRSVVLQPPLRRPLIA